MDSLVVLHPNWQASRTVLIFGGCMVTQLRQYIHTIGMPNLGLGIEDFAVHFYGHPHMAVVSATAADNIAHHLIPAFHSLVPDLVILIVGSYDLWFESPTMVAAGVYSIARYLITAGCQRVVIGQLATHPTNWFRQRLTAFEDVLIGLIGEDADPRVSFCRMPGFRTAPAFILEADASLNMLGLFRLYRGVRGAILRN